MSTRSCIVEKLDNGSFKGTTIYWDGYLSYVGQTLNDYYKDPKKVNDLINLGQISGLGKYVNPSPLMKKYGFDYYQNDKFNALPQKKREKINDEITSGNYTSAYHRDRGESWKYTSPFTWKNASDLKKDITSSGKHGYIDPIFIEYLYLYENKHWYVIQSDELGLTWDKPLTVAEAIKLSTFKAHREKVQYEKDLPNMYKALINHFGSDMNMLRNDLIQGKRGYSMIYNKKSLETMADNENTFIDKTFANAPYSNTTVLNISSQFCCDSDELGMDWKKLNHKSLIHILDKSIKTLKNKLVTA